MQVADTVVLSISVDVAVVKEMGVVVVVDVVFTQLCEIERRDLGRTGILTEIVDTSWAVCMVVAEAMTTFVTVVCAVAVLSVVTVGVGMDRQPQMVEMAALARRLSADGVGSARGSSACATSRLTLGINVKELTVVVVVVVVVVVSVLMVTRDGGAVITAVDAVTVVRSVSVLHQSQSLPKEITRLQGTYVNEVVVEVDVVRAVCVAVVVVKPATVLVLIPRKEEQKAVAVLCAVRTLTTLLTALQTPAGAARSSSRAGLARVVVVARQAQRTRPFLRDIVK